MHFVIDHSYLIPLLPLLGALVAGLFGAKFLKGQSHWPIWLGVGAAAVMSLTLLVGLLGGHGPAIPGAPRLVNDAIDHLQQQANAGQPHLLSFHSHWFDWIVAGDDAGQFRATAGAFI
ncbi:MAG TPA: hypothetical protein VF595_03615, partial [Tepidisphaeraceae bacterium]